MRLSAVAQDGKEGSLTEAGGGGERLTAHRRTGVSGCRGRPPRGRGHGECPASGAAGRRYSNTPLILPRAQDTLYDREDLPRAPPPDRDLLSIIEREVGRTHGAHAAEVDEVAPMHA